METERICRNCGVVYNSNIKRVFCSEHCSKENSNKVQLEKREIEINRVRQLSSREFKDYECNRVFRAYIRGAESRGIYFDLPFSYFESVFDGNCYYCGDKLNHIGIDRIDSCTGYQTNNVVPCCTNCNTMKLIKSKSLFIGQCIKIADHQRQKNHREKL